MRSETDRSKTSEENGAAFEPRRLAFYALGFLRPKLKMRLAAIGITLSPLSIGGADGVVVWGRRPVSKRGILAAKKHALPLYSIEDAFIRSIHPSWQEAPIGIIIDKGGIYYDSSRQAEIYQHLRNPPDFDHEQTRALINRQIALGLSKYNAHPRGNWNQQGYVLIFDQTKDDASIRHGNAEATDFQAMLETAKNDHPDKRILIRAHPAGRGYFSPHDATANVEYSETPANIWDLLENAIAVYVVTSQAGFEAILAGHRPKVFGQPFYAGWGLTQDQKPLQETQQLSAEALYHIMMERYPYWFDASGRASDLSGAMAAMEAKIKRRDLALANPVLLGFRAWKRPYLKWFFPNSNPKQGSKNAQGQIIRWGERHAQNEWIAEDGFLRSKGLGAKLVPPLSLIVDKTGIYFDPSRQSDLEGLIWARKSLSFYEQRRIRNLISAITSQGVSKYNLPSSPINMPENRKIVLVVGQVEDDRSILLGATGAVKTNAQLLQAARKRHPDAFIIYKPHPDVEAGLRKGKVSNASEVADLIYHDGGLDCLWERIDLLVTISSLSGFEALIRGVEVECFGMPFYAGWGLTKDHAPQTRRRGEVPLESLAYAALIDYPLYYDPVAGAPSTPEIIIERLAGGETDQPLHLRVIAKAQQLFYRGVERAKKSRGSS